MDEQCMTDSTGPHRHHEYQMRYLISMRLCCHAPQLNQTLKHTMHIIPCTPPGPPPPSLKSQHASIGQRAQQGCRQQVMAGMSKHHLRHPACTADAGRSRPAGLGWQSSKGRSGLWWPVTRESLHPAASWLREIPVATLPAQRGSHSRLSCQLPTGAGSVHLMWMLCLAAHVAA